MGSIDQRNSQTIFSNGIYHGLPDLSYAPNGMTAVVTGANGISGAHMIRVLAENPDRWSKIYALSRRPPSGNWPKTVEHIPLDFLSSPEDIAKVLKDRNINPDYVFFFSYVLVVDDNGALQWGDQRLVDKNGESVKQRRSNQELMHCQTSSLRTSLRHFRWPLPYQNASSSSSEANGMEYILAKPTYRTKKRIHAWTWSQISITRSMIFSKHSVPNTRSAGIAQIRLSSSAPLLTPLNHCFSRFWCTQVFKSI